MSTSAEFPRPLGEPGAPQIRSLNEALEAFATQAVRGECKFTDEAAEAEWVKVLQTAVWGDFCQTDIPERQTAWFSVTERLRQIKPVQLDTEKGTWRLRALRTTSNGTTAELNIKRVADVTKVSRQTIYRWWSTKGEILLEAVREQTASQEPNTSSLEIFLQDTFALGRGVIGEAMIGIMADAQREDPLHQQLQQFIGKRRTTLTGVITGQTKGVDSFGMPIEVIVDMLFGAMWYRLLDRHALINDTFACELTKATTRLINDKPQNVIN